MSGLSCFSVFSLHQDVVVSFDPFGYFLGWLPCQQYLPGQQLAAETSSWPQGIDSCLSVSSTIFVLPQSRSLRGSPRCAALVDLSYGHAVVLVPGCFSWCTSHQPCGRVSVVQKGTTMPRRVGTRVQHASRGYHESF